jgi:ATP-binding cassette subfamily C protein
MLQIAVQVLAALGQAIGVLLLVPLLGAVGVHASGGIAGWTNHLFLDAGVRPTLAAVLAVYVTVNALSAALSAYHTVLSTRYRLEFTDHLRARLYAAVALAEWRHVIAIRQSDVLAVLTTNSAWVGAGAGAAADFAATTIVIAAQLAAAVRVSPAMTGLGIVNGAALLTIVWPLVRRSRLLGKQLVDQNEDVLASATGFLDGLKLVKAFGRERSQVAEFERGIAHARYAQIGFARVTGIAGAVQSSLTAVLLAVTVYVAVRLVHVPVTSLLVVAFVFTRVISQLTSTHTNIQQMASALPAFDEMLGMIIDCEQAAEPYGHSDRPHPRVPIGSGVVLEDVEFEYESETGRVPALRGVSLELPAGEMTAIAGPSGAGKTTLADVVAALIAPTAGTIVVGGLRLTPERMIGWRRSIALVPQDPFLFHDTIAANLHWACPTATDTDLLDALRLASADDFVEHLPRGLETIVGDRGVRLSGGERQRIALARALLRDPDLLILDEATSSLDTENERHIREALAAVRGRTTILLIAHRLSTITQADQIIVLDGGRVIERGSWSELSNTPAGRLHALVSAGGLIPLASQAASDA